MESHQPPRKPAKDDKKTSKAAGKKTLWVDVHRCFECGRHGHNLPRCRQCSQAYYCDADCQRKHWPKHRPVCRAAVAALARRANRERLARAVREKGTRDNVEGAEKDDLCVICQSKPKDPVEVCLGLNGLPPTREKNRPPSHKFNSCPRDSSRVATSTASRASRSCGKKAWTNRAPSAASHCRPDPTSSSISDAA